MKRRAIWCAPAIAMFGCMLAPSAVADQIYVSVTGRSGAFIGESARAPNRFEATKLTHQISVPNDPHNLGRSVGVRQHGPIRLTKLSGPASVQFYQALIAGDVLSNVVIDFVGTTADGSTRVLQTIRLTNARVVGIDRLSEADGTGGMRTLDDISLAFGRIEIMDPVAGISVADQVGAVR